MKFNARRAQLEDMPGLTGVARVARRSSHLLGKIRRGDVVVIDEPDLDEETAQRLVERGVVAVVNACPMVSGRYPNTGPQVLARAGVAMVDGVGRGGWSAIADGRLVRVYDGVVHSGGIPVAEGRPVRSEDLQVEIVRARTDLAAQLDTLVHNAGQFLRREQDLVIDGRGLPDLTTQMTDRPVIVVAECDPRDITSLERLARDRRPVVLAVGPAADDLIGFGWVADVVVTGLLDETQLPSADALRAARDVVVVTGPGALGPMEVEITESLERLGLAAHRVETTATAEDVALLIAEHHGATPILGVGLRTRLEDFLERREGGLASSFATRLKVGSRLVDSSAVPALESGGASTGQVVALLTIGIAAVLGAVAVTPVGQDLIDVIADQVRSLL